MESLRTYLGIKEISDTMASPYGNGFNITHDEKESKEDENSLKVALMQIARIRETS